MTDIHCHSLGISSPDVRIDNGVKIYSGRVDVWDGNDREGWQYPPNWQSIVCNRNGTPPPNAVYGLCSEKDGKSVTICINQMTDNPTLAKQIFQTFRWTDQ